MQFFIMISVIPYFQLINVLFLIGIYVIYILVPGLLLYVLYLGKTPTKKRDFVTFIFFINVVGISIYIFASWSLILLSIFYFWAITATITGIILALLFFVVRSQFQAAKVSLVSLFKKGITFIPRPDKYDLFLFAVTLGSVVFIFIPVFLALLEGNLIAGDSATFSQISNLFISYHKWPDLATAIHIYYTPSSSPPGISVLYTLLSMPINMNAAYATYPIGFVLTWLTMVGVYLVSHRITNDRFLSVFFSIFWMFGMFIVYFYSITNLTILISPSGTIPDMLLAEVLFSFFLFIIFDKPESHYVSVTVTILSLTLSVTALSNPLVFILAIPPYTLFLGLIFLKTSRKLYYACLLIPAVVVSLTFVPYLTVYGGLIGIRVLGHILNNFSIALLLGFLILSTTSVLYLIKYMFFRKKHVGKTKHEDLFLTLTITVATLILFILFYGSATENFLGVGSYQTAIINSMFVVFLVGILYVLLFKKFKSKNGDNFKTKFVTLIVLMAFIIGGFGYYIVNDQTKEMYTSKIKFDQNELQAANWINANLKDNGTVLLDGNMGNVYSLISFRDFIHLPNVAIPQFVLNNSINYNFPPYNLPYIYGLLMISWPNYTNSLHALQEVGYKYFIFQKPYNQKQITLYSELPFMYLVYNNSEIYVFEFVSQTLKNSILVDPVNFVDRSSNVMEQIWTSPDQYGGPLRQVYSVYTGKTIITAKMLPGNVNSTFVQYNLTVKNPGHYTFLIHTYVYHPVQQSIGVFVNGKFSGILNFREKGWYLTQGLQLSLKSHVNTIKIVFYSNSSKTSYFNPIDYLLLNET